MITLFTTSFTMPSDGDLIDFGLYFADLKKDFQEVEIDRHDGYTDEVWVYSITYPAYQAKEYAQRMQEWYNDKVNMKLVQYLIDTQEKE